MQEKIKKQKIETKKIIKQIIQAYLEPTYELKVQALKNILASKTD